MTILIDPKELYSKLNTENTVIFDCRYDLSNKSSGKSAYLSEHIPNSFYCDLENDMSDMMKINAGRHPLPTPQKFEKYLQEHGVNRDTEVIVYDEISTAYAARMFWLCRWVGLEKVRYLDGGIKSWKSHDLPLNTAVLASKKGDFISSLRNEMLLEMDEISADLNGSEWQLIDARDSNRFQGKNEPLDLKPGHIPGALNHFFQANLDESGCFLPADKLLENFKKLTDTPSQNIVHSCGSGVTACHNYMAMEISGLKNSKLYAGSWSQWCSFPNNPVAVGE